MIASVAIHGALLALAFALLPGAIDEPRPAPQVTMVDVELPPRTEERQLLAAIGPGTPGTPGTPVPARSTVPAGLRGRRGHAASPLVTAPPVNDPFAELSIKYDTGDRDEPRPGAGVDDVGEGPGAGVAGTGRGLGIPAPFGNGGGGGLRVPAAPPSQARGPRPKHDYSKWAYRPPPEYGGSRILLELTVDAQGRVSDVRVLQGTGSRVDDRAVSDARGYEFYPALDHAGAPTTGFYRWEFEVEITPNFAGALNRR